MAEQQQQQQQPKVQDLEKQIGKRPEVGELVDRGILRGKNIHAAKLEMSMKGGM